MRKWVRPIAICVFRNGEKILVAEGYDPTKKDRFYRPLGGTIEFGEHSSDSIIREIREELGAEITDLSYIGTTESIFENDGKPGHEIVLVYDAKFVDQKLYETNVVKGRESDGTEFVALWKTIAEFKKGGARLVPEGLLDLLETVK